MPNSTRVTGSANHESFNQPGPLPEVNLFDTDIPLKEAVKREGGGWAVEKLHAFGATMGSHATLDMANTANRHIPELHTHNPQGERIDEVVFHPAYHQLMALAISNGIHSIPWTAPEGGHVVHTALEYLFAQIEGGVCCPVTMTYAAVPVLRQDPTLADTWLPKLLSNSYDQRFQPAELKSGITIGMAMTEKQGGSDLQNTQTHASHLEDHWYRLEGHKWFCSAPMSDGFFTLAKSEAGLSCFWVPRWRPDHKRNPFLIQRLKDKLGNRSNASAEIEYKDTWGRLVGEPGRGIPTIMAMVKHTRLDTCLAPAALMRQAMLRALHHIRFRQAFGKALIDQPLMKKVVTEMAVDLEASVALLFRIARTFDDNRDSATASFSRIASGIGKFYLNKLAPVFVGEALEILGGNGYVEDHVLARLYRESPLNGIWEGSGNVICLDVLGALKRHPDCVERLFCEFNQVKGFNTDLDNAVSSLHTLFTSRLLKKAEPDPTESGLARHINQQLAIVWQAALLAQHNDPTVATKFCEIRIKSTSAIYGAAPYTDIQKSILQKLKVD